jgi:hypothetical protein
MARLARAATPFIVIGIAFLALGMSGRRAFLYVGVVFMIVGILRARRAR